MEYSTLGNTDIKVSRICLGTMTWGEQNSEAEAHEQLDYALARGVNFIDTAELYPVPPKAETQGLTETHIGAWLARQKRREQVIIATKVCARGEWLPYLRDGQNRLDKRNINLALDASLKRLQTDYIDLYQLHWPERDANFFGKLGYHHAPEKDGVAIEETLAALAELVQAGKVRHIGISNETAWGAAEYLRLAREKQQPRIVSIQNPYNLLNRTFEIGLAEFAQREQVGLLAYSPLGFGVLSGKYLNDARPAGSRLAVFDHFSRYTNPEATAATAAYVRLAEENGLDPAGMALAYVNSRPFLTSNIIGATGMAQLKANIDSIELKLSKDLIRALEAIHVAHPNPCP